MSGKGDMPWLELFGFEMITRRATFADWRKDIEIHARYVDFCLLRPSMTA